MPLKIQCRPQLVRTAVPESVQGPVHMAVPAKFAMNILSPSVEVMKLG